MDLLSDKGISLDEILVLSPLAEGTTVNTAASIPVIREMMAGGLSPADAILPRTKPKNINQLSLFD